MAEPPSTAARPSRLVFVCTANRLRSPFAAALAKRHADSEHLAIEVASAGFLEGGRPAGPKMVAAARGHGIDLSEHVSSKVSASLLEWADLAIGLTGEHVLRLVGIDESVRPRALTLGEWAESCRRDGPPRTWDPTELRTRASVLAADRDLPAMLSGASDVPDPIRRSRRIHRQVADQIDQLLRDCFATNPDP